MASRKYLRGTPEQARIRVLLILWDMGAHREAVKKGDLTDRMTRTNERAQDYAEILKSLTRAGAIETTKHQKVSLLQPGLEILRDALLGVSQPQCLFGGNQISTKIINALVRWMRQEFSERAARRNKRVPLSDTDTEPSRQAYLQLISK